MNGASQFFRGKKPNETNFDRNEFVMKSKSRFFNLMD